jgi:ketosteroid isomerase-like protein
MMTRKTMLAILIASFSLMAVGHTLAAQDKAVAVQRGPKAEIRSLVDRYMQSIDDADTTLGATVWSPTPDVTFINPLGHERGWDEIASVVYGKLMGQTFTKRTLKNVGDVSIHVYGDAAVVEIDWDFVAILRSDGTAIHTTGRESQVYVNLPGKGWRLVHVHYSGPPVAGAGQGF